jgi:DNA-binding transcriptional ArsR family regulator
MTRSLTTAVDRGAQQEGPREIVESEQAQDLLAALEDEDCRAILRETVCNAFSAGELAEACDLPVSTTYRKVDVLTESGLLEERIRISKSGKHTSEYALSVDTIQISIDADSGISLELETATETGTAGELLVSAD